MPATSSVTPTGDAYVDGVLDGIKWAVSSFTFSFPTNASYYGSGYGYGEPNSGFQAFNATQQAVVRDVLASYASVANITFTGEFDRNLVRARRSSLRGVERAFDGLGLLSDDDRRRRRRLVQPIPTTTRPSSAITPTPPSSMRRVMRSG